MIFSLGFLIRILTLLLFLLWWMYWQITEKDANIQKPKATAYRTIFLQQQLRRWGLQLIEAIMVLQVFGLQLLPFQHQSFVIQIIGFMFVFIGVGMSVWARKTLGINWAHAYEYQVKKEQALITSGVYSVIRHPIYSGLCLAFIGGELVAQSYLAIIGLFLLAGGYWQARQEEEILLKHFGSSYKTYMKHTKMFLPYLW